MNPEQNTNHGGDRSLGSIAGFVVAMSFVGYVIAGG